MSQRAARRRRERVERAHGADGAKRGRQGKLSPRAMTMITVGVALALVLGVWLANRASGPNSADGGPGSVLAGALGAGSEEAAVTVVEFGDYKCPYCQAFDATVYPLLAENYIAPGLIRFQYVHFPFIGPDSITAALATKAIQKQDPEAAWQFHHALFAAQGSESTEWATRPFLLELAAKVVPDIDHDKLAADLNDRAISTQVRSELDYARRLGINSTPSVMVNGAIVESPAYEDVKQAIDGALAAAGIPMPEPDGSGGDDGGPAPTNEPGGADSDATAD